MKRFKILFYLTIPVSILSSCKYKPGANQPPVPMAVDIHNPAYSIKKVWPNNLQSVGVKLKIFTLVAQTNNAGSNLQQYGTPTFRTENTTSSAPSTTWIWHESISQPKEFAFYANEVWIQTRDCGWPVPAFSGSSTKGAEVEFHCFGPTLAVPNSHVFWESDFSALPPDACN
jgi:hypothetical protein